MTFAIFSCFLIYNPFLWLKKGSEEGEAKKECYRFMFPVDLEPLKLHNGVPDDGIVSCVTALGCLRTPPISSIIADIKNAKSSQALQHKCPTKANGSLSGTVTSTALDDLIHLSAPLTEDAVLKCLQARFCAKQYHVSQFKKLSSFHLSIMELLTFQ